MTPSSLKCRSNGAAVRDKRREIRCYDYVNHPYESVRDALKQNALTVFQSATKTAASGGKPSPLNRTSILGVLGEKRYQNCREECRGKSPRSQFHSYHEVAL